MPRVRHENATWTDEHGLAHELIPCVGRELPLHYVLNVAACYGARASTIIRPWEARIDFPVTCWRCLAARSDG